VEAALQALVALDAAISELAVDAAAAGLEARLGELGRLRPGVEAAARQMDVVVNYRAPDIYSLDRMKTLIDQAVASKPVR